MKSAGKRFRSKLRAAARASSGENLLATRSPTRLMRFLRTQPSHAGTACQAIAPLGKFGHGPAKHANAPEETSVKLYGFFRSSAAYRVRIALNLKKLPYAQSPVHLTRDGGWQWSEEYRAINPQKRVPALALSTGEILLQSLAIIEYLDEIEPEPPLLPADAIDRAQVRAVSQIIACDIHPLNNTSALNYLKGPLKHDQAAVDEWYRHWVMQGFDAVEALIHPGPYAFGSHVSMADLS